MARIIPNLADAVLLELERLQRSERRPLGELVSEPLARALAERREDPPATGRLAWTARPMGARVDPEAKEALHAALDLRTPF